MDGVESFRALGVALGLGLLVGLQREQPDEEGYRRIAGIRTFPLITLFGVVAALLAREFGGWVLAAGIVAVMGQSIMGTAVAKSKGTASVGITTEIAIILMFAVGALLGVGETAIGVVVGGGTAVLLHAKPRLRGLVTRLSAEDVRAIMVFALLSLVILPILPDRTFGVFPLNVLNPRRLWLMVVLVTGVSLVGFLAFKFLGRRAGMLIGGLLGGLISSTATTLSFARRSAKAPGESRRAAFVVMAASSVVWVRVLILLAAVDVAVMRAALLPFVVLLAVSAGIAAVLWRQADSEEETALEPTNPTNLRAALAFAAIFGVVQMVMAWSGTEFGARGVYAVAAAGGLTDMDAVTLTTAGLAREGKGLVIDTAWRAVLVAAMSNLVFKGVIAGVLGSREMKVRAGAAFGGLLAACAAVLVLWPKG